MTHPTNLRPSNSRTPSVDLYANLLSRAESRKSSYLDQAPSRPCDAHLRRSFEHSIIHDGMKVSASFAIPLRAPANALAQKAKRCRPISASRHMPPIEAPLEPKRPVRGLAKRSTLSDRPARASQFNPRPNSESSILDDTALQIVKKDNRQGNGSPGRSRVCKSVSSPARRQDQVIDLEIVPTKVGGNKQRKRRREDDDDISSLSEESKQGKDDSEVQAVEEVIILDDDEEPRLPKSHQIQATKRKKSAHDDSAKTGKVQRRRPQSQNHVPQSVQASRPKEIHSTGLLGQKRKSDHLRRRESTSKVLQPAAKAPRLTESNRTNLSLPSAASQPLTPCPAPSSTKLQSNTRRKDTNDGPRLKPPTSTALISSLKAKTQFHQTAHKTAAINSNPSTSPRNAATSRNVALTAGPSAARSAGPASATGIGTKHVRDVRGVQPLNRQQKRQSLPFGGAPLSFRATPLRKPPSQPHLLPHPKPKPENRAVGFRKVVTNPCPSSAANHRKLGDVSPPNSSGLKRFNSVSGSTEVTCSSVDVTIDARQRTILSSRSSLTPEKKGDRKASNSSAKPSDSSSQLPSDASKNKWKEQSCNSINLLASRAKQAGNVTPGSNTPPTKSNWSLFRGIPLGNSAVASSRGKSLTDGSKSPLANSGLGARRAFTPARGAPAADEKNGGTLGTPLRRRLTLSAQRVGVALKKYSASANAPQTLAEKWSKKAEQLLVRRKPESNGVDRLYPKSAVVHHEGSPRENNLSQGVLPASSRPAPDSRNSENKVRKAASVPPRRMPPFQPVRRRADRPRTTSAAPLSFPVSNTNQKLKAGSEKQRTSVEKAACSGAGLPGAGATEMNPSSKKRERISNGSLRGPCRSDQVSTSHNQRGSLGAIDKGKYQTNSTGARKQQAGGSIQKAMSPKSDSEVGLGMEENLGEGLYAFMSILPVHIPACPENDSVEDQGSPGNAADGLVVRKEISAISAEMSETQIRQRWSPMMAAHPFSQKGKRTAENPERNSKATNSDEMGSEVG
eukprot:GFKZ01004019.1.p1 GENE.GFKZ01004019.1~~GFKZ01004019.1.p1  ORF type:complete len:1017 (-),score=116.47 GFKZ01004019.1:453-3503(-)